MARQVLDAEVHDCDEWPLEHAGRAAHYECAGCRSPAGKEHRMPTADLVAFVADLRKVARAMGWTPVRKAAVDLALEVICWREASGDVPAADYRGDVYGDWDRDKLEGMQGARLVIL